MTEALTSRKLTVEEDLEGRAVLAVVGDDDTRASDDLAGLAFTVDLLLGLPGLVSV